MKEEYLTDPEEISRGVKAGVVDIKVSDAWATAQCVTLPEIKRNMENRYVYRVKPGCTIPPKEELLTNPEEISRGILAGVVEVTVGDPWSTAAETRITMIQRNLADGYEYRVKPGCTIPSKIDLLTDPEEISRGVKAGVVEFWNVCDWAKAGNHNVSELRRMVGEGVTYRVKPGCTIPSKIDLLTDPEEIFRGIQAGVVEHWSALANGWFTTIGSTLAETKRLVQYGLRYRVKPGCKIPTKEELLTDPEEISRGVKAGVVELWKYSGWDTAGNRNVHEIKFMLRNGEKYRVKPGRKLP
jgi:hypothetical protein